MFQTYARSYWQKCDALAESFKIVFKDISKFDEQNPIIGSLLSQIECGKLTDKSVK